MACAAAYGGSTSLFLCGDVMLGRGIDQILPCPGAPALRESLVRDARTYVGLAEAVNGRIRRPVDVSWPWGDALALLDRAAPEVRIINLETSITTSDDFAPGKGVHYRMHPANIGCLTVARPDVCVLANNHVLDFGRAGLAQTLEVLAEAGLPTAGAGSDLAAARRPAIVPLGGGRRVVVLSIGTASSGIPAGWAASAARPGVNLDPPLTETLDEVGRVKRPGDVVVASIHWGSNWGYEIAADQIALAHALVDGGVDVVHGHSSHHPRPIEIYRGRLVLYGCGDLIDDYEGIAGHDEFRNDLRLLYVALVDAGSGRLVQLRMTPLQAHRMRLRRASTADTRWLQSTLQRASRHFDVSIGLGPDGCLTVASSRGGV
ncbi:CapA family protein [Actinoplanes sp. NPDC049316]|uniref:CapA family protein n=1 Tax=Actinoplanes sp. NPDC049316 TaxID=3154727 RepID=UPI003424BC6D